MQKNNNQILSGQGWVLSNIVDWLNQSLSFYFVTVLKTWGAAPLPAGSWLGWQKEKGLVGAVSGGCIEADIVRQISDNELEGVGPWLLTYGGEKAQQLGLPCGGQVQVLVEYHSATDIKKYQHAVNDFTHLLSAVDARKSSVREIHLPSHILNQLKNLSELFESNNRFLRQRLTIHWQVLLIGASEISRCVASLIGTLNMACFVWEPREAYRQSWDIELAPIVNEPVDRLIKNQFSDSCSAVMTLAHDPKLDDIALLGALENGCGYIGALGSKKTQQSRFQRLQQYADQDIDLNRIHAPIGLDIGSRTPAEIAVAVVAELIAVTKQNV